MKLSYLMLLRCVIAYAKAQSWDLSSGILSSTMSLGLPPLEALRPPYSRMISLRSKLESQKTRPQRPKDETIEYSHGCVLHASDNALDRIDRLQSSFVRELRVSEGYVFLVHNFAPLELRRDIGILGFIHKRVLGECHPAIMSLLVFSSQAVAWRHPKQLGTYLDNCNARHGLYWRSLFVLVHVYNRLPDHVVASPSVQVFQARLTEAAKIRCAEEDPHWRRSFRDCRHLWHSLPCLR